MVPAWYCRLLPRAGPKILVIVEAEPSLVPDRCWLEDLSENLCHGSPVLAVGRASFNGFVAATSLQLADNVVALSNRSSTNSRFARLSSSASRPILVNRRSLRTFPELDDPIIATSRTMAGSRLIDRACVLRI